MTTTSSFWLTASAAVLAALSATNAMAQQPPAYITADREPLRRAFGEALASRVFSDQFTVRRQAALAASAKRLPGFDCPQQPPAALVSVFPWPALPGRSAWIERYAMRCQPSTVRNFVAVEEGGEVRFTEMAPGLSNTDPLLQRDLMQGIGAATVRYRPPGCNDPLFVLNVRMTPEASPSPGRWREAWEVSVCGQKAEIRVGFQPSAGRGTTWTIERNP
ncbi:hypothetical protein E8L99_22550 [Phreatobacter aquaticus]|uniref:Uncharacterized protein n=1 Tax=Phreatobacter aquaticus TaxID=2570229 RepID=A0A4D7QWR4_9HYPH|nr:hypothetical protein [Phreatobacter aquaticus]QCK88342.1 hypothetical protein E8L99_22550 [Phreatobacter aquaticus]